MVEGSTRLPSGTSWTRYFKTILVADVTLRNVHAQIARIQSEMAWVRETAREATRQRYSEVDVDVDAVECIRRVAGVPLIPMRA